VLVSPFSSQAHLSEQEAYLYCDKNRSKLSELIEQVTKFDENQDSPVWRLHEYIDAGFCVARADDIFETLAYAEEKLDQVYRQLDKQQAEALYADFYLVMNDIDKGLLDVDMASLSEDQKRDCCNLLPNKIIKVREKLYVLNSAKFFKNVDFKDNVEIEGTLSVADETVGCDITVGCNINMNNSTSALVGNVLKGGARFIHNFGTDNTFVGVNSGNFAMTGANNTAVGSAALALNTSGNANTALGGGALQNNTTAINNTAVGAVALQNNITGINNTAVGAGALQFNTVINNTAVGTAALNQNTIGANNTAVGTAALSQNTIGDANTAIGSGALVANTTGDSNTAVGSFALTSNVTGLSNVAVGANALQFNTANSNTAVGALALSQNTIGLVNTATGYQALAANTTGDSNTGMGVLALGFNTIGSDNAAFGALAMNNNTTGNLNTAMGASALADNTTGNNNTAIGQSALSQNTIGSNNIALGALAGQSLTIGDNNVYIANQGVAAEANTIRIGTLGTHAAAYMQGIFGAAVAGGGLAVEVDAVGKLGTVVSSAEFKKDIQNMDIASEDMQKLRPVKFVYRNDKANTEHYGLIAEEVAQVFPELVVYDLEGKPYSVRYQVLPVMLLSEVQKQHARMEALAARVAQLEARQ